MEQKKSDDANLEDKRGLWVTIGLVGSLAMLLATVAWTSYDIEYFTSRDQNQQSLLDEEIIIVENVVEAEPPPPKPKPAPVIEIVDDEEVIDEDDVPDFEFDPDDELETFEPVEDDFDDETPYVVVEQMPQFPGCEEFRGAELDQCVNDKVYSHIINQTKYPQLAIDAGIQGTVFVGYVINKEGNVEDVKVLRKVHPSLDKEAVRVIKQLPKFTPGKQQGRPVPVQYQVPVAFTIK